jgi:DeoR/GlpR family transcriptional regulator of sugar metabolism
MRQSKSERQARIVAELRATPALRVFDLAHRLTVSTETVRRDFAELEERGLINRTYGGALRPISLEPAIAEREQLLVEERERMALYALQLIKDDDILMLGGGATTLHFARRLAAECNHLTIITHAFSIAAALATNPMHKVLMLPGEYDGREGLICGADTIVALQKYRASKAILGASGITAEGASDAGIGPGLIYGTMMRRSAETLILADHSKVGRTSLSLYGEWSAQVTLVTDAQLPADLQTHLSVAGTKIFVA